MRNWTVAAALALSAGMAQADCGRPQVVQPGDTVFSLAEEAYGDREKWTLIYRANAAMLEASTFKLAPGAEVLLPCEDAPAGVASPGPMPALEAGLERSDAKMVLLTGSHYAPFADRDWPEQGMTVEILRAALALAPDQVSFRID